MAENRNPPSVGYFPPTFPRDPIEVNIFLEHVLLGQTIEPLVETGADGGLEPGFASRWEVSNDGKSIKFHIREDLTFSDGKPVTAADAVFSLQRHINSTKSQSKAYLSRILSIRAIGEHQLALELDRPYIAIFKALSRDQLGIVPSGWKFDANRAEPFTGTGPYRIVRENGQWRLIKNERYRNASEVSIPRWDLLFYDPKKDDLSLLPVPDLVPMVNADMAATILAHAARPDGGKAMSKTPLVHFLQSSAWYYPHGKHFKDAKFRKHSMLAVQALFREVAKKYGIENASGVIPQGIAGHLTEVPKLASLEPGTPLINVSVSVLPNIMKLFSDAECARKVEAEYRVKFKFLEQPVDDADIVPQRPDVIATSYAGGFQDPEGFLTVISAFLQAGTHEFLGSVYDDYAAAAAESSWKNRAELYKKLNSRLVADHVMVPGWRPQLFILAANGLSHKQNQLRYALKLKDYSKGGL